MADDINMTTILSPLTRAAQIRRVKPTDPENERRSSEKQQHRRKKHKGDSGSSRDNDAVEVELQKTSTQAGAGSMESSGAPQQNTEAKPDVKDKSIDIRV